jgi:tRNA1Val (adenine37-N6)-methyltransferase
LKKSGRAYIIYPATRIVELLSSMRISGIEPKKMQTVHSHDASHGEFVLVEGIKSGREELEVMPPLFIYSEGGKYTEAMTRIFREISGFPKDVAG